MNIYYKIQSLFRIPVPIFIKKYLKKYYGLNKLDEQIKSYLNFNNGFFVELGAHDGITQSNTFYYEKNKNWNGILIEPTPNIFLKLKKNRSKKNFYFNRACVSFKFKKNFIELVYSGLKTFSPQFMIDKRQIEHTAHTELTINDKIFTYKVRAVTLNSILIKAKAPKIIDFLSLDTEGAEFEVLNGIDFKRFSFRYMLIETYYFSKLKKFFLKKNYKYIKKINHNDYLFKFIK